MYYALSEGEGEGEGEIEDEGEGKVASGRLMGGGYRCVCEDLRYQYLLLDMGEGKVVERS